MLHATRKVSGIAAASIAALLLTSCLTELDESSVSEELVSSNGITVTGSRWITPRTLEADITTAMVSPSAVNGPHRIRITMPSALTPAVRYPVIYLLHGGAGGNSAQWTTGGGAVEHITAGKPVIVVMADGGKVGWFTNWVDQSRGAQQWADFYLTQLIPWVDVNFATVAARNGRAIAGLSMGGYGAVRLAQDRPDLFASVASFSGAVDLGDLGTRTVVTEQSIQYGMPAYGAFGSPWWPSDTVWKAKDPMRRPTALAGMQILLYAGAGNSDGDILERTMGQSADRFSRTLAASGVPHCWWMYGRAGPSAPFGCDGGHNFGCWNFAFNDALPRMLTVLQVPSVPPPPPPPPPPPSVDVVDNGGFENGMQSWQCAGQCGADVGVGLARNGAGDGWVRNTSGWNDLHQTVTVVPNRMYQVRAWIRASSNNTDGFFGLRTTAGQVVGEQRFSSLGAYTQLSVTVSSGNNTSLEVFAGLWANGDTWLQVDDVSVVGL